jgi:hypothetical protein
MSNNAPLEFYFDNRNGRHDITPVSTLYRIGIVNTTKKSIDHVNVRIARIDFTDEDKTMRGGVRSDLWKLPLLMMHDRSVPLKDEFTLHPLCEQALDFVQSVPSVEAEYLGARHETLNIGRKIVVWHAARRYWRGAGGGILEDYAVDPQIEANDYTFYLEAKIGEQVVNKITIDMGMQDKKLWIRGEFAYGSNLPKRIQGYSIEMASV